MTLDEYEKAYRAAYPMDMRVGDMKDALTNGDKDLRAAMEALHQGAYAELITAADSAEFFATIGFIILRTFWLAKTYAKRNEELT